LQRWKQAEHLRRQPTLIEHLTRRLESYVNENAAARETETRRHTTP